MKSSTLLTLLILAAIALYGGYHYMHKSGGICSNSICSSSSCSAPANTAKHDELLTDDIIIDESASSIDAENSQIEIIDTDASVQTTPVDAPALSEVKN